MTGSVADAASTADFPSGVQQPEPGERGRLEISSAVLCKIAEHAADLVYGSVRVHRRVAGVELGEKGASAQISGPDQELHVRLDLALRYPVPVRQTVESVRERVDDELSRLAGCHARTIDVTISALVPARQTRRVE